MSEENTNFYVCSRGILKSCDYHSLTPQSSIRQLINYPSINIQPSEIPSIYVCSSAIPNFINYTLPSINFKFILVSGDCDETIPNDIMNENSFNTFINDNRLIHWFCQNMTTNHDKITKIPIGLDYHTLTQRPIWGPITSCQDQEDMLKTTIDKSIPFWNREIKCYANFHFSMDTKLGYDRKDAYANINKELVYYEEKFVSRTETWNKQINYTFVICPHGGGLDCHRNWEALCLGCIPIVKTSPIDDLYKDLPVLIVNDWKDINSKLLNDTINDFKIKYQNSEFKFEKLQLDYWVNLINSYKTQEILQSSCLICGCVRNCEKYLDGVFENIKKIQSLFKNTKIIISYDNSEDNTLEKIIQFKEIYDIDIIINNNTLSNQRTINIENARNKIIDKIYSSYSNYEYFIMMDMDDVCSKPININVLNDALQKNNVWDGLFFNNENYYDFWALSFNDLQYSCWHTNNPKKIINIMNKEFKEESKNKEFISCQSAFGGFGIYKISKFNNCKYRSQIDLNLFDLVALTTTVSDKYNIQYLIDSNIFDCEHRYFHFNAIKKNNAKLFIYNKYLFPVYVGIHTNILD